MEFSSNSDQIVTNYSHSNGSPDANCVERYRRESSNYITWKDPQVNLYQRFNYCQPNHVSDWMPRYRHSRGPERHLLSIQDDFCRLENVLRISCIQNLCSELLRAASGGCQQVQLHDDLIEKYIIEPYRRDYTPRTTLNLESDGQLASFKVEPSRRTNSDVLNYIKTRFDPMIERINEEHVGRHQDNVVIVTDERETLEYTLAGFDERVTIMKRPGLKMEDLLPLLERHSLFGKGTIFVIMVGTHNFLKWVAVDGCKETFPKMMLVYCNDLDEENCSMKDALGLHYDILKSTENDTAMFCDLVPISIKQHNEYFLNGAYPSEKMFQRGYRTAVSVHNAFAKYHSLKLGLIPWDLESIYFETNCGWQQNFHVNYSSSPICDYSEESSSGYSLCGGPCNKSSVGSPKEPSVGPSSKSSAGPSSKSSASPSSKSSADPSSKSSADPSSKSSADPSIKSSAGPSSKSSAGPSSKFSAGPSSKSSAGPSSKSFAWPPDNSSAGPSKLSFPWPPNQSSSGASTSLDVFKPVIQKDWNPNNPEIVKLWNGLMDMDDDQESDESDDKDVADTDHQNVVEGENQSVVVKIENQNTVVRGNLILVAPDSPEDVGLDYLRSLTLTMPKYLPSRSIIERFRKIERWNFFKRKF